MRNSNNFSAYKKTTLLRRAERRMGMNHLDSLADYLRFLQANPNEADELGRDMLIGVSSFFRDPEAFEELGRTVIAPLVRQRENNAPLRVWIPGCSTGEEAYSIAILLLEELDAADKNCPLQVFATDVDGEAVKFARNGIYPHSISRCHGAAPSSVFYQTGFDVSNQQTAARIGCLFAAKPAHRTAVLSA